MLYFNTLPKIVTPDQNGNPIILTNLLIRAKLIEELQNNPMLFYKYDIQDGDTPEIIAHKYYNDPNRFWLIMYSNQLMDPLWSWPLSYQQLLKYIDSKYEYQAEEAGKTPYEYAISTVYAYQKIVYTTDSYTQIKTKTVSSIDEATYNSLSPSTETFTLESGDTCTVEIDKTIVTIFDHEFELNEAKRTIKILNVNYASQMENTLEKVMGVYG